MRQRYHSDIPILIISAQLTKDITGTPRAKTRRKYTENTLPSSKYFNSNFKEKSL